MQLISVYLYPNLHDIYFNINSEWPTERYQRVYAKNIKIYRGMDNRLDFQVRNSDQKKQDISNLTPVLVIINREDQGKVLEKDLDYLNDDATTGRVFGTITEFDLQEFEPGLYQYSVFFETRTTVGANYTVSQRKPAFVDSQYGAVGTLEVFGNLLGAARESFVVTNFSKTIDYDSPLTPTPGVDPLSLPRPNYSRYRTPSGYEEYFISSLIDAQYYTKNSQSLHSFALYMSNYTGTVVLEGSIDEGGDPTIWSTISETEYTEENLLSINTTGKWKWFRIRHTPSADNQGTLDKILYR